MGECNTKGRVILGISVFAGLLALGALLGGSAIKFKEYERVVSVKGLAEAEYPADVIIWPISFAVANNNLNAIYESLDSQTKIIEDFLISNGIEKSEITFSSPAITDKLAQQYGGKDDDVMRFTATGVLTVYSKKVDLARKLNSRLAELGKKGIVFTGEDYRGTTEYIFNRLNEVKPPMIEEATRKAREVAEKFARDSNSKLGKIKSANQGQFSITDRDKNNPHIKAVRVVSTVEYYLTD